MSLFYPPNEPTLRAKASDKKDMVKVRFVELSPPGRIVEAASFVTTDPAFLGERTMTALFEAAAGEPETALVFKNLPPGLWAGDNEAGAGLSQEQLTRRFEWRAEGCARHRPARRRRWPFAGRAGGLSA